MKERPILFNGEMIRAILEGRKTQERRVIRPQPIRDSRFHGGWKSAHPIYEYAITALKGGPYPDCPYGQPGDKLWVRETFTTYARKNGDLSSVKYRADHPSLKSPARAGNTKQWKSPVTMPRWASRITLEITDVRVERVQDISEEAIFAEGIKRCEHGAGWKDCNGGGSCLGTPKLAFQNMVNTAFGVKNWNFFYSWPDKYPEPFWNQNPWVWVIEFNKHEKNV